MPPAKRHWIPRFEKFNFNVDASFVCGGRRQHHLSVFIQHRGEFLCFAHSLKLDGGFFIRVVNAGDLSDFNRSTFGAPKILTFDRRVRNPNGVVVGTGDGIVWVAHAGQRVSAWPDDRIEEGSLHACAGIQTEDPLAV